jgi:CheY-like chemotaxis protein
LRAVFYLLLDSVLLLGRLASFWRIYEHLYLNFSFVYLLITNCNILYHQLKTWQIHVDTMIEPTKAIECLTQAIAIGSPYDIALLDMQMPDLDGEQLGIQIKNSPILRNTHLIMLTSLDQSGAASRMLQIGFIDYVCKPLHKSSLLNSLLRTVAESKNTACIVPIVELEKPENSDIHTTQDDKKSQGILSPAQVKILVAEDSLVNQKVVMYQLGGLGYKKVDMVANGQEAVDLTEKISYDIILMDCQMPILDGYAACRKIRDRAATSQNHASSPAIIIALTANARTEDRDRCLAAGMNDFLSKPLRKEELEMRLNYWLQIISQSKTS